MAVKVNQKLKSLIQPSDDNDIATDVEDGVGIDQGLHFNVNDDTKQRKTPPAGTTPEPAPAEAVDAGEDHTSRTRSNAMDPAQEPIRLNLLAVTAVLLAHTKFTATETRLETLQWLLWLHERLPKRVWPY